MSGIGTSVGENVGENTGSSGSSIQPPPVGGVTGIFVDASLSANITNGTYSAENRDASGTAGDAYITIQEAVNNLLSGEDIYLRGDVGTGTHTFFENVELRGGIHPSGTAGNYCSMQSYPGEWCTVDGGNNNQYVIGKTRSGRDGGNDLAYWKFERLEIKNGGNPAVPDGAAGLYLSGGPFIVRFCYIHDNYLNTGNDNPAGITGYVWNDSLVEFSWFFNNGGTANNNNCHIQIFGDYIYTRGLTDLNEAIHSNEYRYNYFDTAYCAIKHKGAQFLAASETDFSNQDLGDKIHHNYFTNHNIIGGDPQAIFLRQDFTQVYNNIHDVGGIYGGNHGSSVLIIPYFHQVIYNNQIKRGTIASPTEGINLDLNPQVPYTTIINNILDSEGSYTFTRSEIIVQIDYGLDAFAPVFDGSNMTVDYNLIYDKAASTNFNIGDRDATGDPVGLMSATTFNTNYSVTNYDRPRPGLYVGSTGSEQYITNPSFTLGSGLTVSNGGSGGAHPYLSGVTFPSYVGAVNPDDNAWVDGVYNEVASVAWLTAQTLGSTPTWVET